VVAVFTVDVFAFHYIQLPSSCLPLPPGGGRGFPVPLQERDGILAVLFSFSSLRLSKTTGVLLHQGLGNVLVDP